MKKSKSWIHVCVRLLLFVTFGVHSATLELTAVTDDTHTLLPTLRQNIPKDYKIPVNYIPKEVGGMCWVKLNVFYLEQSLQDLAKKFGNISSNKDHIHIIILCLYDVRMKIDKEFNLSLEELMFDFECHYRNERWETERYFDFVKELYGAAHHENYSYECDPPPCPTIPPTVLLDSPTPSKLPFRNNTDPKCPTNCESPTCTQQRSRPGEPPDLMKLIILSLLFVSLLTLILLCVAWKVRSRRNRPDPQQRSGEDESFTASKPTEPPVNAEAQEKFSLNVIETV